jgi:hypothetical protein
MLAMKSREATCEDARRNIETYFTVSVDEDVSRLDVSVEDIGRVDVLWPRNKSARISIERRRSQQGGSPTNLHSS